MKRELEHAAWEELFYKMDRFPTVVRRPAPLDPVSTARCTRDDVTKIYYIERYVQIGEYGQVAHYRMRLVGKLKDGRFIYLSSPGDFSGSLGPPTESLRALSHKFRDPDWPNPFISVVFASIWTMLLSTMSPQMRKLAQKGRRKRERCT